MTNLPATGKDSPVLEKLRLAFLEDAPGMAQEYTDRVRLENTAGAYRDWFATVGKMVPGLQPDPRAGYENLQTISVTFGENFTTSIVGVKPVNGRADVTPPDIEDAVIKSGRKKPKSVKRSWEALLADDAMRPTPPPSEALDPDAQELMELLNGTFTPLQT